MNEKEEKKGEITPPSMVDALIPIISLIILLGGAIFLYGDDATSGPTQVALILCTMIAGLVSLKNGHRWEDMGHAAISFIYALVGFQIRQLEPEQEHAPHPEQVALYGVGNRRAEPTTPQAARP